MFEKNIEFIAHSDYFDQVEQEDFPIPTKLNIPDWFKKLNHNDEERTIKGCIPFLETLTSGYLLKMPQDMAIEHNFDDVDENGKSFKNTRFRFPLQEFESVLKAKFINVNSGGDMHGIHQLGECPFVKKNKELPFYKIVNPWKIKTPPGYSCLFVPPLNNYDDRFQVISGIVDTDVFPNEVNFPIILNGDKYPYLKTIITKGTPYVQVIPFKRDNWKMKIKKREQSDVIKNLLFNTTRLVHNYKNKWWKKKSWK